MSEFHAEIATKKKLASGSRHKKKRSQVQEVYPAFRPPDPGTDKEIKWGGSHLATE